MTRAQVLEVVGADPFAGWDLPEGLECGVALGSAVAVLRRPAHHRPSLTLLGDDAQLPRLIQYLADTNAWPWIGDLSLTVPNHLLDDIGAALGRR